MPIHRALLLGALSCTGCLGEPPVEEDTGGVKVEPQDVIRPVAEATTAWAKDTPRDTGEVSVVQAAYGGALTFTLDLGRDLGQGGDPLPATPSGGPFKDYTFRGERFAIAPPADGAIDLRISQSTWLDPLQTYYDTRWGIVLYHRPAGTRNAWELASCGPVPGLVPHSRPTVLSVFPSMLRLEQTSRTLRFGGGYGTYDQCGIVEPQAEFAVLPIPISIDGDIGAEQLRAANREHLPTDGTTYSFYVEARCSSLSGGTDLDCPAYVDQGRASQDYCLSGRDLWLGGSVRALTMLERGNLKRLLRGHLAFANLGLFVTAVAPEASPSELALGDVLLSIDHHPVTGDPDLPAAALARVLDKVGMGVHQADIVRTSELRLMTLPVNVGLCPILR